MDWFELIKDFYEDELWTKEQVAVAVRMEKITAEQFQKITGEAYIVQDA